MAEYRLTPAAERDLEGIWQYTCDRWSIEQAHRYTDRLIAAFSALAEAPKTAPACDHIRSGYRRLAVDSHVIYYRITAYGIAVVRILHSRMDTQRNL